MNSSMKDSESDPVAAAVKEVIDELPKPDDDQVKFSGSVSVDGAAAVKNALDLRVALDSIKGAKVGVTIRF